MDNRHLLTLNTTPEAGGLLRPPCLLSAQDVLAPLLGWRGADNRDRDRAVRRSTRSRLPGSDFLVGVGLDVRLAGKQMAGGGDFTCMS